MAGQNTINPPSVGPIAQQPLVGQPQKKMPSWTGFSGKTLWDWLQLLAALAIPLAVALGTSYFTYQQGQLADVQHQRDVALQTNQQRETVLATYIQDMKDLISAGGLQKSKPSDEVRVIARAQTLITLRQLDGTRRGIVMQFLSEARLVIGINTKKDVIIDLSGADLSGAELTYADLRGADLRGAHLSNGMITQQQIDEAITCKDTITPEGITPSQRVCP